MTKAKKLIEVALPIKEISAESVRDKSIRHGHISTLHLWWARRPLPVCRAVIFASLVPDPLDTNCPKAFCDAVQDLLAGNMLYAPYPDIPYTAIYDPMPDNLRNRLLMFIGKFSHPCQLNMLAGKSTPSKDQIQEGCLIKWESKNDPVVLRLARLLIWVAYNAERHPEASYKELATEFDLAFNAIKEAENNLYNTPNRHLASADIEAKEAALQASIESFQNRMPSVFDPFAGGGAIPLEAARLGCRSYGNDINPVAHIIEKGSVEFPQKYGKPITYTHEEFMALYGKEGVKLYTEKFGVMPTSNVEIPNRLSFDVEFYAKKLLAMTEAEVGHLYPSDEKGNKPVAYYWARTATCSNPSCRAEVPLLKQFYLANTKSKKVYLNPIINETDIQFEIKHEKYDEKDLSGWNNRGNMTCPCCGNVTPVESVKKQFKEGKTSEKILAVIYESNIGKQYHLPSSCSEDMDKLKHTVVKSHAQELARRLFLFSYYCYGISFIDAALLTKNNIIRYNGGSYIVYKRNKTKEAKKVKPIQIKITSEIQELMDWFASNTILVEDYLLPIVSIPGYKGEQLYNHIRSRFGRNNKNLANLAQALGITDMKLTSYVSRHTMAMTLQDNQVPREVISQILGHSDLATTNTYLDSFASSVIDEAVKVL